MKALADKTEGTDDVHNATVDANVIGERSTAVQECDNVIVVSSESEAEEEKAQVRGGEQEEQDQEQEEEVICSRPRKSKKKHKKHHHHHHHEQGGTRLGKKHKKRPKPGSGPIFLWAKKEETQILKIYCEDYDPRIKLVKTNGVWTSSPRSKVLAATQSRSSVCKQEDVDESQNDCIKVEPVEVVEPDEPDDPIKENPKTGEPILVDLNDNSIDFVDTISSEEEDDEEQTRAKIDRALEMIDRDPALMSDIKIPLPTAEGTATIKLPEGTTIHQIKAENIVVSGAVTVTSPPQISPKTPSVQCKLGELTITTQQQQQNEPLNLETVSKRSALEIQLQEPPLKKKRVDKPPAQLPLAGGQVKREWNPLSELKEVLSDPDLCVPDPLLVPRARLAALVASPATEIPKLLRAPSLLPPPPPDPDLLAVSLSHLRSVLQQQPGYSEDRKPDSNQSSKIEQMLWLSYLSKDMTGVDTDLIAAMLSILLPNSTTTQQSFSYPQDKSQWNDMYFDGNIEPPYGSTPGFSKSDDCCASVSPLPPQPPQPSPLLPPQILSPPQILPPPQQSHPQLLPPSPLQMLPPTVAQPPILSPQQPQKHQPSLLLPPPQTQQQVPRLLPKRSLRHNMTSQLRLPSHPQQMPQLLPSRSQQLMSPLLQPPVPHRQPKRRACQELCCNGSPSSCYDGSCCPKSSSYNPFTAVSPNGCNPFTVPPGDCNPFTVTPAADYGGGNPKTCATYAVPGGMPACCFPSEIGCGYNNQSLSPMPMSSRNQSISPRNRAQYNYQTGPGQQQQKQQMSMTEGGSVGNGCCVGVSGCSSCVAGSSSGVASCSSGIAGCSSGIAGCSSGITGCGSGVTGSNSGIISSGSGVNGNISGVNGSSSSVNGSSSRVNGRSGGVHGNISGVNRNSSGINGSSSIANGSRSRVNGRSGSVNGNSSGVNVNISGVNGNISGVNSHISGVNSNINVVNGNSSGVNGISSGVNSNSSGGSVSEIGTDSQCSTVTNKPKTPLPATSTSGDAGQPVYRPKIKVKEHLIDPNAKPRLLNIEGALHMAAGHDLFSSSLWHPLFGSQAKPYGCRWQWTTPVTTSASTSSDDPPAAAKR